MRCQLWPFRPAGCDICLLQTHLGYFLQVGVLVQRLQTCPSFVWVSCLDFGLTNSSGYFPPVSVLVHCLLDNVSDLSGPVVCDCWLLASPSWVLPPSCCSSSMFIIQCSSLVWVRCVRAIVNTQVSYKSVGLLCMFWPACFHYGHIHRIGI